MKLNSSRRKLTAWLSCLAILLASLAPTLAHALVKNQSHALQQAKLMDRLAQEQTCHSGETALEQTALPPVEQHGQHDPASFMEHCPFCLTHLTPHGPPVSAQKFLALPDPAPEWLPARGLMRLAQGTHWHLPVSRAPPFIL
jgi:hypothetical protein